MIVLFSPKVAYKIAYYMEKVLGAILPILLVISGYLVYRAPVDIVQGISYLWIYLHVPAAVISLFSAMFVCAFVSLGWVYKISVANILSVVCAEVGLVSSLIALFSGAIWGSQTWGAWWVWDMRLTSELLLAILYAAFLTTEQAVKMRMISKRIQFYISLLIAFNVPLIHFSVEWWYSLHQTSTLLSSKQTMPYSMYVPLMYAMFVAVLFCIWYVSRQLRLIYAVRFQDEALSTTS
jgi:heme exporter protein C